MTSPNFTNRTIWTGDNLNQSQSEMCRGMG